MNMDGLTVIESIQYETIRQQCLSFKSLSGFQAELILKQNKLCPHVVLIVNNGKLRRLADPDLNVIIMQLAF